MSIEGIMEINAQALDFHRQRIETAASNLSFTDVIFGKNEAVYQPAKMVASMESGQLQFTAVTSDAVAKAEYNPSHPKADEQGMVRYAPVDQLSEMLEINKALRAYEANVKAMTASRQMILKALEIGSAR